MGHEESAAVALGVYKPRRPQASPLFRLVSDHVLRLFVRLEFFDEDQAAGMLAWPHSGFHVHTAVWVPEDDLAFATRLARYCAQPFLFGGRPGVGHAVQSLSFAGSPGLV